VIRAGSHALHARVMSGSHSVRSITRTSTGAPRPD
jgi:hypothetical protein